NENLCTRYNAKMVKNVKIGPSPRWMREYLRGCGIRPINNIVDITNYVCLEYGQPMHAFDYRYVNGGEIIVRNAKNDEKITTLDGIERILTPDILVIADTNAPVAVAGVMGGEFSGVMDDTTTIVFEAASFNNVSVRKTSRKLALRTESSSRFEKGLPEDIAHKALLRACHLVEQLECGEVLSGEIDIYPNRKEPVKIKFEPHFINKFIGINISQDKMVEILNYLNFKVENDYIVVPSFRTDIEHKSDIAEEIARIYGYNNIPSTILKGKAEGKLTQRQLLTKKLSSTLCSCGLNEIMTYSFISPKYYDKILMKSDDALRKSIVISNPLGEDTSVMRTTALPSILEVISRNINYRNDSGEFYELATEYIPTEEKLPQEIVAITLGMYGEGYDFFTIKGIIEKFLRVLKYKNISFCANCENPSYHPGRCADVFIGEDFLGTFGEIHPNVIKNYDISQKVYCAKLSFEILYKNIPDDVVYTNLPKFPKVTRDLALICNKETPVAQIEKIIKDSGGNLVEEVVLFDVYEGKQIEEGKKSVAYNINLRSSEKTLTDEDCNSVIKRILKKLTTIDVFIRA
ncbi:MAG: phenylalanine--tRNA ligase subunit beta, partial [Oscillospiraceae bacterium]